MPEEAAHARKAPLVVERFIKQLYVTYKAVKLYPPTNNIPRENAAAAISMLRAYFQREAEMRLYVSKDALLYDASPVFGGNPVYAAFAREFYIRKLAEVRFHSGVRDSDIALFLSMLLVPPEEILASGGFEARLWDQQVDNITVREVTKRTFEAAVPTVTPSQTQGEPWPPTAKRIDELLSEAFSGNQRARRLLVQVIEDRAVLQSYLEDVAAAGAGGGEGRIAARAASLAHIAWGELPGDQPPLYRSLLEATFALDEPLRGVVLRNKLLSEARADDAVAALVHAADVHEFVGVLVDGLAQTGRGRDTIARTVRALAHVSTASREDVLGAFEMALRDHAASNELIAEVFEAAAPTTLRVRERTTPAQEAPVDSILRLVGQAPATVADVRATPRFAHLAEEARVGITDGDVLNALVDLVTLEHRDVPFATIMSLIEDGLGLLLGRGDFEVAAEVASAIVAAENKPGYDPAQARRLGAALNTLANPEQMRYVHEALRLFPHDSIEYQACRGLLEILGAKAISPLLEVLAQEPDMAGRKALVDLISEVADRFVEQLGDRVSDGRWYFVRNVVGILANVRDPRVLTYFERTLRYPDARVRRETIRGIAGLRERRAYEMLVAALEDDDIQNVQLAARYLGTLKVREGLEPLLQVARGEGRGNREAPVRVEAIEALGRMGYAEAVPTLESLARQRSLLGRGVSREFRAAAESALRELSRRGV